MRLYCSTEAVTSASPLGPRTGFQILHVLSTTRFDQFWTSTILVVSILLLPWEVYVTTLYRLGSSSMHAFHYLTYAVFSSQANKADIFTDPSLWGNRSFSLAFADGPYGMLLPATFYDRNPGLPFKNISIGFQPEIGSVSMPTYFGLTRFMSSEEIESGYPMRNESKSRNEAWEFYKALPWTTRLSDHETYDHVYAYFSEKASVTAADWIAAAQLASHAQYQNLFNGFISHIFIYTTVVILWKTQSPWPSLRGFLYDWYLESTGTLRGARAALGTPVSISLDLRSNRPRITNRQVIPLLPCGNGAIGVSYTWIDLHGSNISSGKMVLPSETVPAMTTSLFGKEANRLTWPANCTSVCFLMLRETGSCRGSLALSWAWLTDPSLGQTSDFSALGQLRSRQSVYARIGPSNCIITDEGLSLNVLLSVDSDSPDILFYPTISLIRNRDGAPLLPVLDNSETDVVLVPGASQRRQLQTSTVVESGETVSVMVFSWNSRLLHQGVVCNHDESVQGRHSQSTPRQDDSSVLLDMLLEG